MITTQNPTATETITLHNVYPQQMIPSIYRSQQKSSLFYLYLPKYTLQYTCSFKKLLIHMYKLYTGTFWWPVQFCQNLLLLSVNKKWLYSLIIRKAIWNGSESCKSRRGQKYPCIQNVSWTGTCIYRTLYMRRVSWACKTYKIIHASWRSSFTYGGHLVLIISTPVV